MKTVHNIYLFLQKVIANVLLDDEPFGTIFVNSILTQLNWAFSEFILLLQEVNIIGSY